MTWWKWPWRKPMSELQTELDRWLNESAVDNEERRRLELLREVLSARLDLYSRLQSGVRRVCSRARGLYRSLRKQNRYRMKNLAGRLDCDLYIARELGRAQIEVVRVEDAPLGEVLSFLRGRLGPIDFAREWRYYIAEGPVPVEVARYLYEDPVGRRDAWACGLSANLMPEGPWVTWYTADGARVYPCDQEVAFRKMQATWPQAFAEAPPLVFHDQPEQLGARGYVEHYHLVSEGALQVFASALRRYAVDRMALPCVWNRHRRMTARVTPFSAETDNERMGR